jgi:hypothetical protein
VVMAVQAFKAAWLAQIQSVLASERTWRPV